MPVDGRKEGISAGLVLDSGIALNYGYCRVMNH